MASRVRQSTCGRRPRSADAPNEHHLRAGNEPLSAARCARGGSAQGDRGMPGHAGTGRRLRALRNREPHRGNGPLRRATRRSVDRGPLEVLASREASLRKALTCMCPFPGAGQVFGGHLCYGNTIRTTAEVLLASFRNGVCHERTTRIGLSGTRRRPAERRGGACDETGAARERAQHLTEHIPFRRGRRFRGPCTGCDRARRTGCRRARGGRTCGGGACRGSVAIGRARIRRLEIDELVVRDTSGGRGLFPARSRRRSRRPPGGISPVPFFSEGPPPPCSLRSCWSPLPSRQPSRSSW